MSEQQFSTKNLKRTLGFWDLMGASIGQIIGAGIMSLTGVAIAMTGRSVPISFMLSAIMVLAIFIPTIIISSTARFRGGQYSIYAAIIGEKWSGFFTIIFIVANISIALYAISFAQYAAALFGSGNPQIIAIVILTLLYVLNFFGVDKFAAVQKWIVIVLVAALAMFSLFGITKIDPNYMSDSFLPKGWLGMMQAAALLTFATGGASSISNFAAEAINPKKDIPRVIIISTFVVAGLYGFMSIIAAGVLPVSEVAGKPLTAVAQQILPQALYFFFIIGGAMFALVSTLNAQLAWATKPLMQACVDGWFPKKLAKLHPKYNTPVYLLTIMYIVGLIPIIANIDMGDIGSSVVIVQELLIILLSVCMVKLKDKLPELWAKSAFHVKNGTLYFLAALSICVCVVQLLLLWSTLNNTLRIANAAVVVFAYLFAHFRQKSGKINMEVSYEAD